MTLKQRLIERAVVQAYRSKQSTRRRICRILIASGSWELRVLTRTPGEDVRTLLGDGSNASCPGRESLPGPTSS